MGDAFRVVAFVDGFNLYHGLKHKHGRKYLWLDLEALVRSMLKPGQRLDHVFYFTAAVRNDAAAEQRQGTYLRALRTRPHLTVVEGRYQEKTMRCFRCGGTWVTYEEKESDVNIAVSMVDQAVRNNFDTALLVSADSDLCPGITTAQAVNPNIRVIAVFPPKRNSEALKRAAYASMRISDAKIRQSQFPDPVITADGKELRRPPSWS